MWMTMEQLIEMTGKSRELLWKLIYDHNVERKPIGKSNRGNTYLFKSTSILPVVMPMMPDSTHMRLIDATNELGIGIADGRKLVKALGIYVTAKTLGGMRTMYVNREEWKSKTAGVNIMDVLQGEIDADSDPHTVNTMAEWERIRNTQTQSELKLFIRLLRKTHSRDIVNALYDKYPSEIYDSLLDAGLIKPHKYALPPIDIKFIANRLLSAGIGNCELGESVSKYNNNPYNQYVSVSEDMNVES